MARKPWGERYDAYISGPKWAALKARVLARRGPKCERCGASGVPLDLHHLHYQTFGRERHKDVQLVCRPCHEIEDKERRKRGTARRVMSTLMREDRYWDCRISDGELYALIAGGVVDINTGEGRQLIGWMINAWEIDANPQLGLRPDLYREDGKNSSFRRVVRLKWEEAKQRAAAWCAKFGHEPCDYIESDTEIRTECVRCEEVIGMKAR